MKTTFEIMQERKTKQPWCLIVTLTKHYQRIAASCEVIAEWIPNSSKVFKIDNIKGVHYNNGEFINQLQDVCFKYSHPLTLADIKQINEEINKQKKKMSFKKEK